MNQFADPVVTIKVAALAVIYLFLPLIAASYYAFRRHRRDLKVQRILRTLKVDAVDGKIYEEPRMGTHLLLGVIYSSTVSIVGLAALMFSKPLESSLGIDQQGFPADDSLLMLGMAFLGAYLWGIQYVLRRYMSDDLDPAVFYGLSVRMLLAGALAVVIFNGYEAMVGNGAGGPGNGAVDTMWPALAFILGMFPQRGLSWLRERVPVFSAQAHASVRKLPLEMIEGVSMHDRLRLEEHGLDNCFDLATTDFVPLAVSTPYSARTLVDWILQAKLCVYCGEAVGDLRLIGIRTILDLEHLQHDELEMLAKETAATKSALESAKYSLDRDHEMRRLRKIAHLLGLFATSPDVVEGPSEPGSNVWHAAAPGQRADLASEAPMSVAGNRVQPGAQAGPAGSNPGVDPE